MNWKEAYKTIAGFGRGLGNRGQLSPLNIIGFVVILIIFASVLPVVMTVLGMATNTTGVAGTLTETLINLIPVMLVLAIILTLFAYARPYSQG